MNQKVESYALTPLQIDFCNNHIERFRDLNYAATIAGTAGSDRSFIRLFCEGQTRSYILVLWNSHDEDWRRFFSINREISATLPIVPAIYAADEQHGLILEEDCGRLTLKECFIQRGFSESTPHREVLRLYEKVLDALIAWQKIPVTEGMELASRRMDRDVYLWETEYFSKHCIDEYFGLSSLLTDQWHQERRLLAEEVASLPLVCLHRDFQSENIIVGQSGMRFVDFQGARLGAAQYDIASLLFDPYISFINDSMRDTLVDYYCRISSRRMDYATIRIAALQRLAQALGAYGNLSLNKKKEKYKQFIPRALQRLSSLVAQCADRYPQFFTIVSRCMELCRKSGV
ncbi:MAG: phosphotransferase [Chitinivibrionales bacterium]|nr:phosphotransferase [Chitinivibrionales bacterium]